jgi:hypothetical protein
VPWAALPQPILFPPATPCLSTTTRLSGGPKIGRGGVCAFHIPRNNFLQRTALRQKSGTTARVPVACLVKLSRPLPWPSLRRLRRRSRHNPRARHTYTRTLPPRPAVNIPGHLPPRARDPLPIRRSLLEDTRAREQRKSRLDHLDLRSACRRCGGSCSCSCSCS